MKNPVSYSQNDFERFEEGAKEFLYTLLGLAVLGGLLWFGFSYVDDKLQQFGVTESTWGSVAAWVGVGIPCVLFWPLRYWHGMKGQWRNSAVQLGLLCFAGPFALVLGFPL